nr:Ldh family oxidoreductase [Hydrogenophaga sp. 2FB]
MLNRWDHQTLEQWTGRIFLACDVPDDHAREAAAILVRSELRGLKTHGLARVASYVERLKTDQLNARPHMEHRAFPGGIVLNTDGAMGQIAGPHAVRLGLAALERSASILVILRQCGHLGALGIHALLAAEAGAFAMLGQRTSPALAMEGFRHAAIGHNPIAFGCPMPGQPPIVFDVACSVAARGHILLAAREGKPIPEGWALDAEGNATTDAARALEGSLIPMAGHKGLGIAMMVECLTGALAATADSQGAQTSPSKRVGMQDAFLWLVKPGAFAGQESFGSYMEQWTRQYLSAGGEEGRLPGHRGNALEREGLDKGLALPPVIAQELTALGERLGEPLPSPVVSVPQ